MTLFAAFRFLKVVFMAAKIIIIYMTGRFYETFFTVMAFILLPA